MTKLFFKKIKGGVKFFLLVCILYLLVGLNNYTIFQEALSDFFETSIKVLPVLFFVFVFTVLINLFFTKEKTEKYFGKDSGLKAWVYAVISGILISGPPYILYPLLGELKKKGVKNSLVAVFLYNRNVKIPFLPALVYYFGITYTIALSIYIIIFSIINGFLMQLFVKEKES